MKPNLNFKITFGVYGEIKYTTRKKNINITNYTRGELDQKWRKLEESCVTICWNANWSNGLPKKQSGPTPSIVHSHPRKPYRGNSGTSLLKVIWGRLVRFFWHFWDPNFGQNSLHFWSFEGKKSIWKIIIFHLDSLGMFGVSNFYFIFLSLAMSG